MSEIKPIASSPSLLARKGAARPAMRPQVQPRKRVSMPQFQHAAPLSDDPGCIDMGEEAAEQDQAVTLRPAAEARNSDAPSPKRRSALAEGRRAAFTLRVEKERHLRLRLACAEQGRSAQQLLTAALDRLLNEFRQSDDFGHRDRRVGRMDEARP